MNNLRNGDGEGAAFPGSGDNVDGRTMGFDDPFCNGEPETVAFPILSAGLINTIEAIKYFGDHILWNPYSGVAHP